MLPAVLLLVPAASLAIERVTVDGEAILIDGVPTFLKGVCYSPFIAGGSPGQERVRVNFDEDLREIKERLGANAVRIYDPLPAEFYAAASRWGLWVIQGFFLDDSPTSGARKEPTFLLTPAYVRAQENVLTAKINLVHQRGGSEVILAYVIGSGLSTEVVENTIKKNQDAPRYQGTHYSAPAPADLPSARPYPGCQQGDPALDPHPFQSFLAMLADHAAAEDAKRSTRHLIGHATTPLLNPFLGLRDRIAPPDVPVDLGFLDIIFENLFSYGSSYVAYHGVPDYLRRLKAAYPAKPVVILETGYSTSPTAWPLVEPLCGFTGHPPAPFTLTYGGVSEEDQALALEARWVDTVSSPRPFAGFFVYSFYEEWWLGGNAARQLDHPGAFFGLKRVRASNNGFTVSEKPAYSKVAALFGCEDPGADPAACGGLVIRSPRTLKATYGVPFLHVFEGAGETPPAAWEIDDLRLLPPGIAFDGASGKLEGVPAEMGEFRFRVRAVGLPALPAGANRVISFQVGPPEFSTCGREILLNGQPFFLRGIDYSPFTAGDAPWTAITKVDPVADLGVIKNELGANAIRVYQSLPRSVYDAAREYGLFIVQGIHLQVDVPEGVDCETHDLFQPEVFEKLKAHVLEEIDEVHNAGGSDVVLAYVVGNELPFCAQRATIREHQARRRYQGRFYSVPETPPELPECMGCADLEPDCFPDPHPIQSFVAELVDAAASREADRYQVRHLMSHATDPNTSLAGSLKDRFEPHLHWPFDTSFLDLIAQNVYSYYPPLIRFLGYREYLEMCAAVYPDKPFIILESGYSTSPLQEVGCAVDHLCRQPVRPKPLSLCFGGNTEAEQAAALEARWLAATSEPRLASGFFVFEYYDEWWKGSSASEYVQDADRVEEWFGIQAVTATPDDGFSVRKKPAFAAVKRMFAAPPVIASFRRGDSNLDAKVDLSDAVATLRFLFQGAGAASCPDALDANDDGALNLTDAIYELNHLFAGGPALPCPGTIACGSDPTLDQLPTCDPGSSCGPAR
jgi:exo-beta-1,3-glucanase (GH17 family)